ncbi:putative 3-mercaptopyruvate sulfurtransferase [Smittium mucronatum]|uniref:Sulfurtransferase n=1 Tax=Smittium mucronatum TaxID=133383 RepID=A0A1R0GTQ4_9FUNG|nr:putative 3-mercaptopyruvate sulfurtransferase [Smittium mucronatum]
MCSAQWLSENIENVKVLDCSWYLPTMKRDVEKEFNSLRIKNSIFFGIDTIKDHSTDLPHMIPTETEFNKYMEENGISNSDQIVLYDTFGFQGACRVLWNLEAFGHKNVQILSGGFEEWKKLGFPIETTPFEKSPHHNSGYSSKINQDLIVTKSQILAAIKELQQSNGESGPIVIDARPSARFNGAEPEPRPGLTSGHMPFAINVPFPNVFYKSPSSGGVFLKPVPELVQIFEANGLKDVGDRQIITTCGSGITAACLYVSLKEANYKNVAVYDGSWAEYGSDPSNPHTS